MQNVLDIIYDYSKKRKILDPSAIKQIIKLHMKNNNIEIIKTIEIIQKIELIFKKITLGNYLDDYIIIYYSRLLLFINEFSHVSNLKTEDDLIIYEQIFRNNLFIAFIIFHELEHSMQEQISREEKSINFETRLIQLESFYLNNLGNKVLSKLNYYPETGEYDFNIINLLQYYIHCKIDNIKYEKNYNLSFLERLADTGANKKIIDMIEPIKKEIPNLYKLENELLLERELRDYDNTKVSPTIDFFNKLIGKKHFNYDDMEEYNLDERLRLGLPVTCEEFNSKAKILEYKK